MATCKFCKRKFSSRQAVKGHLRWCQNYKDQKENGKACALPEVDEDRPVSIGNDALSHSTLGINEATRVNETLQELSDRLAEERLRRDIRKIQSHSVASIIDLHDLCWQLLCLAKERMRWANLIAGHGNYVEAPGYAEWMPVARETAWVYIQSKNMLDAMSLNMTALPILYQRMKFIRTKWQFLLRWPNPDYPLTPEEKDQHEQAIAMDLSEIDNIIERLRRLLE